MSLALLAFAAALLPAAENQYGVCAHVTMGERAKRGRILDDAAKAGVGWVRTDFRFWMVQEKKSDLEDWSLFESTLSDANRRGMKVLPILWKLPNFQRPILAHRSEWREWVRKAVERCGADIEAVEIGNEPNVAGFWSEKVFRMEDYVSLLSDAYTEIKTARPEIRVSCAGWAGIPLDRIAEFYSCGGGRSCDIVSVHPYCDHEYENRPEGFLDLQLEQLRSFMAKNGDGEKPIWITEIGWPTHRQTLGGAEVLARGLALADVNRKTWRIVVVSRSPDDGAADDKYVAPLLAALPKGSSVEPVAPEGLSERLARGGMDAVVFATGKEFHREAFPAFYDYVAKGGIGIVLAHQAMRDEIARLGDGSVGRPCDAGWGIAERSRLHFEFVAPWHDKTRLTPHSLVVRADGTEKTHIAKSFIGTGFLKGGDSFVPIAFGKHDGRTYHAAGLYVFDSELKGKLLVSTLHDPFFRSSSEERQAKLLARSLAIAFAEGVEKVFWYCFSDVGASGDSSDPQARFGIARADGVAKPALRAYETFAKMRPSGSASLPRKWRNDARTGYWPQWARPDGRRAGAIWTIGRAREVVVPLEIGEVEVFDIYGNQVKPRRSERGHHVMASDSLVYFIEKGSRK